MDRYRMLEEKIIQLENELLLKDKRLDKLETDTQHFYHQLREMYRHMQRLHDKVQEHITKDHTMIKKDTQEWRYFC